VRKMPVPTTAPIVISAPSHAPSARTRPTGGRFPRSSATRSEVAIRGEAIWRTCGGQTGAASVERVPARSVRDELSLGRGDAQQLLEERAVVDHRLPEVLRARVLPGAAERDRVR